MRSLACEQLMETIWPHDVIMGIPRSPQDSLLSRGDRLIIAGEQKSGKSILLAQMMRGLVTGTNWLGFPVIGGPRTVLYVQAELRPGRLKKRLAPAIIGQNSQLNVPPRKLFIWSTNGPLYLTGYKDWEKLSDTAKREAGEHPLKQLYDEINAVEPDVIILDPFVCFHDGDERVGQDLMKFLTLIDDIKNHACPDRGGAAIVIAHHFRKQDPREVHKLPLVERFRGSNVLAGWADSLVGVGLTGNPDEKYLEFVLRDSDQTINRNLTYNYDRKEFDWDDPSPDAWAVAFVRQCPNGWVSTTDFELALRTRYSTMVNSALMASQVRVQLVRRGILFEEIVETTRRLRAHPSIQAGAGQ